jgi:hypothetical protein
MSLLVVLAVAASGDNIKPEQPIDAALDAPVDAAPDGPCASGRYVTGELVHFDSSPAMFSGVPDALFTQRNGTAMDRTSPNGRFEMCAQGADYLFDVDAPGDRIDAIAYIEPEALTAGRVISFRTWRSQAEVTTWYTDRGLTWDATKAHVFVFAAGDRSNLTLSGASHDTPQCGNADTTPDTYVWAACGGGNAAGRMVLCPNVDPPAGSVTVIGDLSGQHTVPVEAGKLTLLGLAWVFLP